MSIIAWITLGLGAGLLAAILLAAYHLATGRVSRSQPVGGKRVMSTGAGILFIAAGVIVRFTITPGTSPGLNAQAIGTGLMLLGAFSLVLSLLFWGPLKPGRRQLSSPRGYNSGTPVPVRAEKHLYQDPSRQLLTSEHRVQPDNQPL
jgi:hypothetical protein